MDRTSERVTGTKDEVQGHKGTRKLSCHALNVFTNMTVTARSIKVNEFDRGAKIGMLNVLKL